MFGGYDTQTIVCILMLLFIPIPINASHKPSQMGLKQVRKLTRNVPYKEAASWKRINHKNSKVDIQRLYDAYRERFREESSDSEDDLNGDLDDFTLDDTVEMDNKLKKDDARLSLVRAPRVYEATDAREAKEMENEKRIPNSLFKGINGENDESDRGKQDIKRPVVSGMVILKLDVPSQVQTTDPVSPTLSKASPRPRIQQDQEASDRRLADLNRIYQEILNQQQSQSLPATGTRRLNVQEDTPKQPIPSDPESGYITNTISLSALSKLLDVEERLAQTDVVNEIAKKINDEMESQTQPILYSTHDASLVTDNSLTSLSEISENDEDGINKLFDRIDPSRASLVFKRVASEMKAVRPLIKTGGLYDEYKKRLYKILKEQKYPRQSITSDRNPIDSESSHKITNDPQYRSEETQSVLKQMEEGIDSQGRNTYLKALETYIKMNKENQLNGGIKPYYLPNSKNRQLVWNEVPLVKPKVSDSPRKPIDAVASNGQNSKSSSVSKSNESKSTPNTALKKINKKPNIEDMGKDLYPGVEPKQIGNAIKALKHSSFFSLIDEYQKQLQDLNKTLKNKQKWWKNAVDTEKTIADGNKPLTHSKRASISLQENPSNINTYPGVLLSSSGDMNAQQIGGNIIDNLASQMNLSPLELAQRIATAANSGMGQMANDPRNIQGIGPSPSANVASQIIGNQIPNPINNFKIKFSENITEAVPSQQQLQPVPSNLSSILDKILQRLEGMQDSKLNQTFNDSMEDSKQTPEKPLPCCFADPADGAPCDLNGSWESQLLGIRINIRGSTKLNEEVSYKPTCAQPKMRTSSDTGFHHPQCRRQCVKINSTQIKAISEGPPATTFQWLNVTIQEITPPREHDIIDNITEWHFSGHALNILGGPISLSCRRADTNLIGTFVGYCRTCGCVDTIFGSWTFCQPSRDCQDITMSIFDRRDMLRRYSMEDRRPNRFKEQLYMRSKFAKVETNRQRAKQIAFDKVPPLPQPQNQNQNQSQSHSTNRQLNPSQPKSYPSHTTYI